MRSPIWSCVGKMRMVPGGSGGGMPGSCGWTGLVWDLAFWRFFSGRGLAIQDLVAPLGVLRTQTATPFENTGLSRDDNAGLIGFTVEDSGNSLLVWRSL